MTCTVDCDITFSLHDVMYLCSWAQRLTREGAMCRWWKASQASDPSWIWVWWTWTNRDKIWYMIVVWGC